MADCHGRVKLTWAQIAWGLSMIAAVLGAWYDTRNQIQLLRSELSLRVQISDKEHAQMWDAISEMQNGRRPGAR